MANNVDTQHKSYAAMQVKRDVFHAVKGGTDALWAGDKTYLPKYPGENDPTYQARKKMSTIDGIVSGGVDGLCGATFHGDIDVTGVATEIQPLLENIDNEGNSFNVFARRAFEESFDGFSVIIVDQPKVDQSQVASLEDKQRLGIRPYWRLYTAANVWNWRYRVNPKTQAKELSLLVLREITEEVKDVYESEEVTRYRVYFFNEQGVVLMRLYRKTSDTGEGQFVQEGSEIAFPYFSAIPAVTIGDLKDEPKLLVESRLEVLGYQKESSFNIIEYLSIPVLWTKGWQPKNANDKLAIGASAHLILSDTPQSAAGYLSIDSGGHASLKETIANIKNTIKARLNFIVESANQQAKTATQANIENQDKQSRLIVWAEQFRDALELALSFTAEAMGMGKDKGGEIKLISEWNANDDPTEQTLVLTALEKKRDVLDIPIDELRKEYGYSEDQIKKFNKENDLMPEDDTDINNPNPDDAGTN